MERTFFDCEERGSGGGQIRRCVFDKLTSEMYRLTWTYGFDHGPQGVVERDTQVPAYLKT